MPESGDDIVCTAEPVSNDMLDRFRQHLTLSDNPRADLDMLIAMMPDPFAEQDCSNVNLTIPNFGEAPDGAKYYAPKGLTGQKMLDALNHLKETRDQNPVNAIPVYQEFRSMYNNPNHPHFLDFKDWGPGSGPAGSIAGGSVSYYSEAAGQTVSGSAFEAFGNYFYGFAGTFAGFSPSVLRGAAAIASEPHVKLIDDPQDAPHVDAGISAAIRYLAGNTDPAFTLQIWNC